MKNQEEIKEVFFFLKNTIFSMAIFEKNNFEMKKTQEGEKKTNFFGKGWREWFFLNTKRLPENEIWTNLFLLQEQFLWTILFFNLKKRKRKFPRRTKKTNIFWKNCDEDFYKISNNRNSKDKSLEMLNMWFFCKKRDNFFCSKEHDLTNKSNKKKERKKRKQNKQSFTERKINKGDSEYGFAKEKRNEHKQKKHKRE